MKQDINNLHPTIHTASGGVVFVNPGTGPVNGATEKNAIANMHQFISDSVLEGMTWKRTPEDDYGDGRFSFKVKWQGKIIDIQMPGWELERVRWIQGEGNNVWDYPRLYVDHGSWIWDIAILRRETFYSYKCNSCGAYLDWGEVEENADEDSPYINRCPICHSEDLD